MAITPLPVVPLRSDSPATFVAKADAFLGALNLFAVEVDAVGVALTLGATNATSTTSLLVGLGSKSLTIQTAKSYVVGMTVKIASTATGSTWMLGDITAYTSATGALVVTVTSISGSGTLAAWTVSQSAPGGAKLGINSDITSLTALDTSALNIGPGQLYKDVTGNVGIGTSSPSTYGKLVVSGGSAVIDPQLTIEATASNASQGCALNFARSGAIQPIQVRLKSADNGAFASNFIVETKADGSAGALQERMRIDSSGNLLVGTASNAPSGGGFVVKQGPAGVSFSLADHASGTATGQYYAAFTYAGTVIGHIDQSGTTGVSYITSSDKRLKTNIVDAPSALDSINAIKIRSFDWIVNGAHQEFGYIAQELLAVVPEAVSVSEDELQMMGVDFGKLTPRLVKAIQEQQIIIEALSARLTMAGL